MKLGPVADSLQVMERLRDFFQMGLIDAAYSSEADRILRDVSVPFNDEAYERMTHAKSDQEFDRQLKLVLDDPQKKKAFIYWLFNLQSAAKFLREADIAR